MPWEPIASAFGISGAVILVGGGMFLRYQRDKAHFRLMEKALEKGITSYQGMVPSWVISLRVGMLCLVLGVGLIGSGVAAREFLPAAGPEVGATSRVEAPPPGPAGEEGHPPPPGPSSEMERWHRMETQRTLGLGAICAGGILVMLGVVRMGFAGLEKKYVVGLEGGAKV